MVFSICSFLLVILCGLLPPLFCWVAYIILFVICFIQFIIHLVHANRHDFHNKKETISLFLNLLFFAFSSVLFTFTHSYHEVVKRLNQYFPNQYQIIGLSFDDINDNDLTCKYSFHVKMKDSSQIKFHSGYCHSNDWTAGYFVHYDYAYYYIPYYLEKYNQENGTNIQYSYSDGEDIISVLYDSLNKKDVSSFIQSLLSSTGDKHYQFYVINEENDREFFLVSSWNPDYKQFIRMM